MDGGNKRQKTSDDQADREEYQPLICKGIEPMDRCVVRMWGLPWRCTTDEVLDFFGDKKVNKNSVVFGVKLDEDNRRDGRGAIIAEDEDEALAIVDELNKQHIGSRFIILTTIPYKQYLSFNEARSGGGQDRPERKTVVLADCGLENSNMTKALVFRGLPFRITE